MEQLPTKPAIESKINKVNIISLIVVVLTALLTDPTFKEMIGMTFVTILNVVLIYLRTFKTDTKIEGIVKPKSNLSVLEDNDEHRDNAI